jgi:hypothetical protein
MAAVLVLTLTNGTGVVPISEEPTPTPTPEEIISIPLADTTPKAIRNEVTPTPEASRYTTDELAAIALTLAGECYEDKEQDKRGVCEVILNRVSDGHFGNSIIEVLTAKNQFSGYWRQSRPVSESDIRIAGETLEDWFANDCEALSEYLYFSAGTNRENIFR